MTEPQPDDTELPEDFEPPADVEGDTKGDDEDEADG